MLAPEFAGLRQPAIVDPRQLRLRVLPGRAERVEEIYRGVAALYRPSLDVERSVL